MPTLNFLHLPFPFPNIIGIADFLLEFAILGHEALADVPNLIHPQVPVEDLRALGVPHLAIDEEGRSSLLYPSIFPLLRSVLLSCQGLVIRLGLEVVLYAYHLLTLSLLPHSFHPHYLQHSPHSPLPLLSFPLLPSPSLSNADDGIGAADAPPRAINDVPVHVTTYFFHRWMWIHFPYVALGNCNQRWV